MINGNITKLYYKIPLRSYVEKTTKCVILLVLARSSKGRTAVSGTVNWGSSPYLAANKHKK